MNQTDRLFGCMQIKGAWIIWSQDDCITRHHHLPTLSNPTRNSSRERSKSRGVESYHFISESLYMGISFAPSSFLTSLTKKYDNNFLWWQWEENSRTFKDIFLKMWNFPGPSRIFKDIKKIQGYSRNFKDCGHYASTKTPTYTYFQTGYPLKAARRLSTRRGPC